MTSAMARRALPSAIWQAARSPFCRPLRQMGTASTQKREGDISDAFASLSGMQFTELEPRFADVKAQLIGSNGDALWESWTRLLGSLQEEIPLIAEQKSSVIPEIDFADVKAGNVPASFKTEHKKRGVAVVRNVVKDDEVLDWKAELREYIRANPNTKAFPPGNPQVFELYWSPAQVKARSHPNMVAVQRFLMEFWHSKDPNALISPSHPTMYADRLRMRLPGDAKFALGPHVDGGSCERWEPEGYGRGKVYQKIWQGQWEQYDPWEASCRLPIITDLYQGVGACSMFRMFQGWLAMSSTGPFEGTLLVNPLLSRATAYFLLRPFFSPINAAKDPGSASFDDAFLKPSNWRLATTQDSWLHGATPGHGQELRHQLHPHLDLPNSMVHMPRVNPGDYVSWHCDTIHAVDSVHAGKDDSSVLYIPSCPLTVANAGFVARQREAFIAGTPCPDFGGGIGESQHMGRQMPEDVRAAGGEEALRAWGLLPWDAREAGLSAGQSSAMEQANKVLGFGA